MFVALPFGLATALRVFTKVFPLVLDLLKGASILGYLDDLLLREQSALRLRENRPLTVSTLENLGRVLSVQKSALKLVQRLEDLGHYPDDKCFSASREVLFFEQSVVRIQESPSIPLCRRLAGKMVSTFEAVPYAKFYSKPLEEYSGTVEREGPVAGLLNVFKSQYHSGVAPHRLEVRK